ncbi:MAG TPA: hypothetical protein VK875_07835 [Euzebyales bacterium]|nr:hypothetical protein [Euzebyales bacterium]
MTEVITEPPVRARPDHRTLRRLAGWYALSRVVVWAAVLGGWALRPELSLDALLRRLDASWYLDIARFGYSARPATPLTLETDGPEVLRGAFSPLWPLLLRAVGWTGAPLEIAATLLATLLGFGVVVASWVLVARLADPAAADRAALLVSFFPGSVVFSLAYAEALMLCLATACLYLLLERRWLAAGVVAALATATRPNAVALVAACAWAAAVAIRRDGEWRSLVAPALAPTGAAAFHGFLWWRTSRPDAWALIQETGWDERVDFGARNAERLVDLVRWSQPDPGTLVLGLGIVVLAAGAWALWRWRPPGVLVVYTAGIVALALVARTLGPRPRFLLTALPLVWALAVWLRGERFRAALLASTGGLAVAALLYIVGSVAKL